jgi:hypothetical protein
MASVTDRKAFTVMHSQRLTKRAGTTRALERKRERAHDRER